MRRLPIPPTPRLSAYGLKLAESLIETKSLLVAHLGAEDIARRAAFELSKDLQTHTVKAFLELRNGRLVEARSSLSAAYAVLKGVKEPIPPQPARPSSISSLLEEMVTVHAFCHFFDTGRLVRQSELPEVPSSRLFDDAEYIGGVIAFAQELNEYSVNRSMAMDTASVILCRDLVDALNGQLMAFDFRNGPLRRKYDSVKYALKRQEDLLYEQSLIAPLDDVPTTEGVENVSKRARIEMNEGTASLANTSTTSPSLSAASSLSSAEAQSAPSVPSLVDESEFEAIRLRLEAADMAREDVIKGCRDGQKLSKLAIYSVHRGQFEGPKAALKQMADVETKTVPLLTKIEAFPTLRPGAFNNVLEEYVEARLFAHWVQTRQILSIAALAETSSGLFDASLDVGAYLGGLVDLTGEIGRFAVASGTKRDFAAVGESYEATAVVATLLGELPCSGTLKKKGGAVATNLRKLGQVRYELALAQRSGNNRRKSTLSAAESTAGGGGKRREAGDDEDGGEA